MESPQKLSVSPPTTIEGIGIHLGYINKGIEALNTKVDTMATNTVTRQEFGEHLKHDEDHETRIRVIEKNLSDQETDISNIQTTIKVWGVALGAFLSVLEIVLHIYIK